LTNKEIEIMKIYVEQGDYGTYLITNDENDEDILVQTDYDFPGLASTFGWDGERDDIEGAREFLDEIADTDTGVEDPGYFDIGDDEKIAPEDMEDSEEEDPFGFFE
jgi:hypothetical protein